MVNGLDNGHSRVSILVQHLLNESSDNYTMKMELFDEIISILITFKNYGLLAENGFHNEELPIDPNHVELISFPLATSDFNMRFDFAPIINNLMNRLERLLNLKCYQIKENFIFDTLPVVGG